MANTVIYRNSVSSGATKITFSAWVKVSAVGGQLFSCYTSNDRRAKVYFASNALRIWLKDSSGNEGYVYTARVFTDPNAFYHIVVAQDNTLSTDTDRIKIYINGVRETATWSGSKPTQNSTTWILGHGKVMHGTGYYNSSFENQYFDGLMSHIHVCYGTALAPTVFGSVDSVTGEWKINTSPSFTPGNNGYTILKDGNTITDQSANSNNFSLGGGTLTATKDCASNVLATLNKLETNSTPTLANGNLVIQNNNASWRMGYSTIATPLTGKFYAEGKMISNTSTWFIRFGIQEVEQLTNRASNFALYGGTTQSWAYLNSGQKMNSNSSSSYGDAIETGDIVGIAIDCTNNKLYFSNNGVWQNSGNPASGSTGTGAISITANKNYFLGGGVYSGFLGMNFGNGFFGTTAITTNSGNGYAGAEGASKFNYAVPSGYSALNTKGLNQ